LSDLIRFILIYSIYDDFYREPFTLVAVKPFMLRSRAHVCARLQTSKLAWKQMKMLSIN